MAVASWVATILVSICAAFVPRVSPARSAARLRDGRRSRPRAAELSRSGSQAGPRLRLDDGQLCLQLPDAAKHAGAEQVEGIGHLLGGGADVRELGLQAP